VLFTVKNTFGKAHVLITNICNHKTSKFVYVVLSCITVLCATKKTVLIIENAHYPYGYIDINVKINNGVIL
jgi:hypothetical protein